jgi:CubicO group peptidase (beta-lactamase class C family)
VAKHVGGTVLLICGLLFAAQVQAQDGGCLGAIGRDFPTVSPEGNAPSAARLADLLEKLDAGGYDIRGLLVLQDCKLVLERYKHNVRRDFNHAVYSVTKSVTATVIGALLYQGRLASLDAPIARIVPRPDDMPDEGWAKAERITLRNAMQMASGLAYIHDSTGHPIYALRADRFAVALTPEFIVRPGTRFNYSDGDASLSGAAAAAAADQRLYHAARTMLFEPMAMVNHDWWFMDSAGHDAGGWGLRLRTMDMLKIGQLYLQGCSWNGRQLCNASFISEAWAPGVSSSYGLHWWLGRTGDVPHFSARGFKGQRVIVLPALHSVIAISATLTNAEDGAVNAVLVPAVIAAIRDGASAEPDAEQTARLARLQAAGFRGTSRIATSDQDIPRR